MTICEMCRGTGYQMVDVGTATIPDYEIVNCRCNPPATDEDAPVWTGEDEWMNHDWPGIDYDPPFRDSHYEGM